MPSTPRFSTPHTSGSSSTTRPSTGSCHTLSATALIVRVARSVSVSYATDTSSSARDQPWLMLPIRMISPLRMCHTVPSTLRSRVVRRLTASTIPLASPASMASPTPYWSSRIMNIPFRKSFTTFCAPKPSATPTTPALAMSGPRSKPSSASTIDVATVNTVMEVTLRSTEPMVSVRWRRRSVSSGAASTTSPESRPRSGRNATGTVPVTAWSMSLVMALCTTCRMTKASTTMSSTCHAVATSEALSRRNLFTGRPPGRCGRPGRPACRRSARRCG